jgi:HKD family nuclease
MMHAKVLQPLKEKCNKKWKGKIITDDRNMLSDNYTDVTNTTREMHLLVD